MNKIEMLKMQLQQEEKRQENKILKLLKEEYESWNFSQQKKKKGDKVYRYWIATWYDGEKQHKIFLGSKLNDKSVKKISDYVA